MCVVSILTNVFVVVVVVPDVPAPETVLHKPLILIYILQFHHFIRKYTLIFKYQNIHKAFMMKYYLVSQFVHITLYKSSFTASDFKSLVLVLIVIIVALNACQQYQPCRGWVYHKFWYNLALTM